MSAPKLQIALDWCAGCGGCDVSVLDTDLFVVELGGLADIRLWPLAADGKHDSLRAMADGALDAALVNFQGGDLSVLWGGDFTSKVSLGQGAHPGAVALAEA